MLNRATPLLLSALLFQVIPLLTTIQPIGREPSGNIFVDKKGVLRWENGQQEMALFGVNYTTPFAYSYRAPGVVGDTCNSLTTTAAVMLARRTRC